MSAAILPSSPYLTLCLVPYNGAPPCLVSSADEYRTAAARYNAAGTEEWEVEVTDGDASTDELAALRTACQTMQPDEVFALADWMEGADDHEKAAAFFLLQHCSNGYDCAGDVIDAVEEVQLCRGTGADYAEELAADCYGLKDIPSFLRYHIDWEGVARDMEINGDINAFTFDGDEWVCTNAAEL